jgi:Tripartite tricarboxylate transporter TctB family
VKHRFDDRDLWAGGVFVAFGVAALALGAELNVGSAAEMGEGYVPHAMALALIALGTLIALLAWSRGPARGDAQMESIRWRPLVFVTAAVLAFVAALEPLGLVAAIACSATAANFAGRPLRARSLAALICVLSAAVVTVFVWGLGLSLNVLPRVG